MCVLPNRNSFVFFSCQSQLLIPCKLCWGTARHSKNEWDVPYIYLVGGVTVPAGHIVAQHWSGAPAALSALSGSHAAKLWSRPVRMQQEEHNMAWHCRSQRQQVRSRIALIIPRCRGRGGRPFRPAGRPCDWQRTDGFVYDTDWVDIV